MFAVCCSHVTKQFSDWAQKEVVESKGAGRLFNKLFPRKKTIKALSDVDLTVHKGEIFGILGANGSGKSTLIRIISTLLIPDQGTIKVFGKDVVTEEDDVRRIINRVSVEASFFKKLSAQENLSYTSRLYGIAVKESCARISSIMTRLGFSREKMNESMENLSRGMQQKVAIARALLTSPTLLLLDEPTTGLDPKSKRQVQEFILEMNSEHGITTILTTHDMNEAELLCHRLSIMKEGRIIALGTPEELKKTAVQGSGTDNSVSLEDVFLKLAEENDDE
ncbi:MAG: ABC transporter ATP-binding protein [Candidatus Xenobiia bacterium LiM19]